MIEALKALIKQPYWVSTLFIGVILLLIPCLTVNKDGTWSTHPPGSLIPVIAGSVLLVASLAGYAANLWLTKTHNHGRLNLTAVKEKDGILSTVVWDCEVRVVEGRIEEFNHYSGVAIALPCNEYFDDRCAHDSRSALGAFVNRVFDGQTNEFVALMKSEARKRFVSGTIQQKTKSEQAESFGSGKCLLLSKPLARPYVLALISTTTQRAGQGLSAQISCLFEGMHELNRCLADERIDQAVMPVLGGGHGGIHPPLAFIGLILAVAEAARYGHGSQRMKRVTIVVFKKDAHSPAEVDKQMVRRALALVASEDSSRTAGVDN